MTRDMQTDNAKTVMVVGGGVAGIYCALNLAEMNRDVVLVEKSPALGGVLPFLHRTYPDPCACCRIYAMMLDVQTNPHVQIATLSEIVDIEKGRNGFSVTVESRPRCVDLDKCIACGRCAEVCPQAVSDGIESRRAVFMPYPQAVPYGYAVDTQACRYFRDGSCRECEGVCPTGAITFSREPVRTHLSVGSVVLSTGIGSIPASILDQYGHRQANVFTAPEFERLQSLSGPTRGRLVQPGTGLAPRRIAWIQCVGSRDTRQEGCRHCSSVCCMHAVKEALGAREELGDDVATDIFYMDLRAFGKGFDEYYVQAKQRGVTFKRSRVHEVLPAEADISRATVVYHDEESGHVTAEDYDMVVLSTGIQPPPGGRRLMKQLGIGTGISGFLETDSTRPVCTPVPGVYVCGTLSGPKDIYDSMIEAGAAAVEAAGRTQPFAAGEKTVDVKTDEPATPRTGVFVCRCPLDGHEDNAGRGDLDRLRNLPGVEAVYADGVLCTREGRDRIAQRIQADGLNQVLVTSCAATVHRALLQAAIHRQGLGGVSVRMVDLTLAAGGAGQGKSAAFPLPSPEYLEQQVTAMTAADNLSARRAPVKSRAALVVGGSISAMVYARTLAESGAEVHLVDPRGSLGDPFPESLWMWPGAPREAFVQELVTAVDAHPGIHAYMNAEVTRNGGRAGDFVSEITFSDTGRSVTVRHGVAHLAPPTEELKPAAYLYGDHPGVATLGELERRLADPEAESAQLKSIVFIQCVGSRQPDRPYCSRTCCSRSLSLALRLRDRHPKADISVLYRDMRTFGLKETLYERARSEGIVFFRYGLACPPVVASSDDDRLDIIVQDPLLKDKIGIPADIVVLACAEIPRNTELSAVFGVDLDANGFFAESRAKMKPTQFHRRGITMSGGAHGPKFLDEALSQAQAAAARDLALLGKESLPLESAIAQVTVSKCPSCCTCVRVCPYGVPRIAGNVSVIDPDLCRGCGACAAACPGRYIRMVAVADQEGCGSCSGAPLVGIQAETPFAPDIVLFACGNCPSRARDRLTATTGKNPFAGLKVVELPCLSRLDVNHLLEAFEQGRDGILVAGCSTDESCLHKGGVSSARRKVDYTRELMRAIGLEEDRLHLLSGSSSRASVFDEQIRVGIERIRELGPSPLKTAKGGEHAAG